MQEIGGFGGGASAADINDDGVVVGNFSAGGDYPWIWEGTGDVRFLNPLIDPDAGVRLITVRRVNERGAILARARDLVTFDRLPVLLLPRGDRKIDAGRQRDGNGTTRP